MECESIMEKMETFAEDIKMKSVIVGRVWISAGVISGYVVVAPGKTIKFGGNANSNPSFLFLSKKQ